MIIGTEARVFPRLRRYVEAGGWTGTEFVDRGVSGAKDKRPALDASSRMLSADDSRCWSLGVSTDWAAISGVSSCCLKTYRL
jgi:hypothetical protein